MGRRHVSGRDAWAGDVAAAWAERLAAKAPIVDRCLDTGPSTDVPASLLQGHADCTWWLDEDATG